MHHDPSTGAPTFGDLLRRHRRTRALSQEVLAERAGVSVRAISDLERGARSHPYRETATLLADALGLAGSERSGFLETARRPFTPIGVPPAVAYGPRLPRPLTQLIGRDASCDEIAGFLREERVRLLTLTGPGGVGKTRLAVAVATSLRDAFRDGIAFVDLAPLQEPSQVEPAIAAALELADQGSIPLAEAVRRRLSSRQMLLVLDNFEHLLPVAPVLSDLLQTAPDVQALVTSRVVLRLQGERVYPVMPLPMPDVDAPRSPAELAGWAAIQLFVERAGAVQPGFQLNHKNAAAVVAICQRLDGLPLAIELAAARIKLLAPDTLLDRLDRALPLLTGGVRDAPPRQRTLRAAITWSYDLLTPHQQALLRCLTVFVGGWTLEAAETVGSLIGVPDPLDTLAAAVEQSLVVRDDAGAGSRYRMLETVREFACEQLVAARDEDRARRAHMQYLLQLARENDLERLDTTWGGRLARLQAEEANLRAGIAWAIEHDAEAAFELLAGLAYYWYIVFRPGIGRDLHERVLKTRARSARPAQARVLQQAAWLINLAGDFAQVAPLADAAYALAAKHGDRRTMAHAQICQAAVATSRGDAGRAKSLLDAALAQCEALADDWGVLVCLNELGIATQDWGDAEAAVAYFERARKLTLTFGLPAQFQARYIGNMAVAFRQLGRHEAAMEASRAALTLAKDGGGPFFTTATMLETLALLLLEHGEVAQALTLGAEFAEGLQTLWETGSRWDLAPALEVAAALMAAGAHPEPAARTLGAAAALREAMPYPIPVRERDRLERLVAEITAVLGKPVLTRAWTAGQTQSLVGAVAEARAVLTTMVGT